MAKILYYRDAELSYMDDKTVSIIGYGSQGHAHAGNLKDSGVDVRVGLKPGSATRKKVEAHGIRVTDVPVAVKEAD
ncbi:MAG: ketol-acid reductoisomerase, partial [Anaerolineae bacterium]|nr:ketol-acid reductoisomerase [Anaerolineae bacterium]